MVTLRRRLAPVARRAAPVPPRLAGRPRRLLRAAHVIVSGAWLGLVVTMLVLGLSAAATSDATPAGAAYALMDLLGTVIIPAFAIATLVTGVVLSAVTPWGLLQHYWVVVKLAIAVAVIVTGARLTGAWVQQAASHTVSTAPGGTPATWLLVAGSTVHLVLLGLATVISVDKPWGKTRRGRRLAATRARRRPGGEPRAQPVSTGS